MVIYDINLVGGAATYCFALGIRADGRNDKPQEQECMYLSRTRTGYSGAVLINVFAAPSI